MSKPTISSLQLLALLWPLPFLYQLVGPLFPNLVWAQIVFFFVPSFLARRFFLNVHDDEKSKASLKVLSFPMLLWGLGVVLLSVFFNFSLPWIFKIFPVPPDLKFLFLFEPSKNFGGFILDGLQYALVPAVCEEFFFRGIVFDSLNKKLGFKTAVGISSFYFALTHFNPWIFLQLLLLGFVFAAAFRKSNKLTSAIFLHALNNFISIFLTQLEWIPDGV